MMTAMLSTTRRVLAQALAGERPDPPEERALAGEDDVDGLTSATDAGVPAVTHQRIASSAKRR